MKKFIIIYTGRCGSSMLTSILDCHDRVACAGELMHPGTLARTSGALEDPKSIWDYIPQKNDGLDCKGFKLSPQHFEEVNKISESLAKRMEGWISMLDADSIICLHREDILSQFVSVRLASINNAWTSHDGSYDIDKISINFDEFEDFRFNINKSNEQLKEISLAYNGLTISYEDILMSPLKMSNHILSHIGVEDEYLFKKMQLSDLFFKQQRTKPLSETISNYAEFVDRYSNEKCM